MKLQRQGLIAACVVALAAPAWAQAKAEEHAAQHPATATAADDMVEGEIRKVDKGSAKITIRHGEIKRLDMPPMTMVFQVKEPTLLDKVKAGDKVRFRAEKTPSGYAVAEIESLR
jgi:Cu(I)/Ag(I) efflux system periplasmic protein CusF